MKAIIDRFEGQFAVCELSDKKIINIEKRKLPLNAREGDVINIENSEISIDIEATKKAKNKIEKLIKNLWNV